MISKSVLDTTYFDQDEEEKKATFENQKKDKYYQSLEEKLNQFKERFSDIESLTATLKTTELVSLVKMKILSKSVTIRLLGL